MKKLLTLTLALTLSGGVPIAQAELPVDVQQCRIDMHYAVDREHRLFRSVLFGLKEPKEAGLSATRTAKDGSTWIKTEKNKWESVASKFVDETRNDSVMKSESDVPPRRGIFEQKRVLTSELLPYILQSFRAFQCRVEAVCETLVQSEAQNGTTPVMVTPKISGCKPFDTPSFPGCHLIGDKEVVPVQTDLRLYCGEMTQEIIKREMAMLKLVVEYDAAYRSLLQFAGTFDHFLGEFRWTITGTMRSAAELIGTLGRIPCFISSCDTNLRLPGLTPSSSATGPATP